MCPYFTYSMPLIHSLPYYSNSTRLFAPIADQVWSIFLDSGHPYSQQGRYDILVSDPVCTLVTRGDVTVVNQAGIVSHAQENPFELLKRHLQGFDSEPTFLPFNGGAVGYFSYDLVWRLEALPVIATDAENIPEMAVGIYHWAVIVDHKLQQSWLVGQGQYSEDSQEWQGLIERFSVPGIAFVKDSFRVIGNIESNMSREYYAQAFHKIKDYLLEGDCYQVNLAQRFSAQCQGSPWLAYECLREINTAPFSSFMNLPGVQILSSSPERFLKVIDGKVETKPIKGTRPRKQSLSDDHEQIQALSVSSKDKAENVMIVDLLRNDISKTCKPGSVKVPKLFVVESFTTVHHLVSTVSGMLRNDKHAIDLLRSCFPGGSITGAPKIRAMEIIEELEPHRRGVYCGSIGYIGFNGNMDTNIAIRTLVHSDQNIRFWAGGGIVNDSMLEAEYQESFDKALAMIKLLQKMS